ncbi:MAG: prolyl oligopeptidase family serine peptidase [Candidatus Limnocylindrales bacterium]
MRRLRSHLRLAVAGAVAIVLVLLAGMAYMVGGYIVYDRSTRVAAQCGGRYADNTPASFTADQLDTAPYLMPSYEAVSFPARGDVHVTVSGWWVPGASADAPTVIQVHGLGSCKRSPTVLLPAGMLHRHGYNVLLIDLRNEGDSTVTNGRFGGGVTEYKDVLGAWDWVRSAKGIPASHIGLAGMSMGAASALIAAGQEPGVAAVWEDSSYADIEVAISDEVARNGFPTFLAPAAIFVGRLNGVDITSLGPLDAVARLNGRPIAIIHGTADTRMPIKHAYRLRQAVEDAGGHPYVWLVDGVDHTQAVYERPAEYEQRLASFFGSAIGVPVVTMTEPGLLAA